MIRRRSTMDHSQRIKHNKLVEMYAILDLCLQLPSDDRITLRNQVKAGDEQLILKLSQCKKDKNYHQLQIYLRKYVHKLKENDKFGVGLQIVKNTRGRTPQTLKSTKNPTDSSYHNSRQNSFQSSPSAKKIVKVSLTNDQTNDGHANCEAKAQIVHRDITPREVKVQIRPLQVHALKNSKHQQAANSSCLSMKNLLKSKISERVNRNLFPTNEATSELNKENRHKELKQNVPFSGVKAPLTLNTKNAQTGHVNRQKQKYEQVKYGQFYKRIKRVIEQAY